MMDKEKVNEVYMTYDYDAFKKLDGNRDVLEPRKDRIRKSMAQRGYIPSSAIIVNEKMEIIDGQARFEVCKELCEPIYFVIGKGLGIDDCIAMNIYQEKWTIANFIKSNAEQGKASYVRLLDFLDEVADLDFGFSVKMYSCKLTAVTNFSNHIKAGTFSFTEEEKERAVFLLRKIAWLIPLLRNNKRKNTFFNSLLMVSRFEGISFDEILDALKKYPNKIRENIDTYESIINIQEIYNYRKSAKNNISLRSKFEDFLKKIGAYAMYKNKLNR